MSLVQRALEARGIVTVSVTLMPEITRRLAPARVLATGFGLGMPFGDAGDAEGQRDVLRRMLALAEASTGVD
ncbi:MAG: hypothetical protein AB7H88_00435 [Vicinamibacterales bacterium]